MRIIKIKGTKPQIMRYFFGVLRCLSKNPEDRKFFDDECQAAKRIEHDGKIHVGTIKIL